MVLAFKQASALPPLTDRWCFRFMVPSWCLPPGSPGDEGLLFFLEVHRVSTWSFVRLEDLRLLLQEICSFPTMKLLWFTGRNHYKNIKKKKKKNDETEAENDRCVISTMSMVRKPPSLNGIVHILSPPLTASVVLSLR